MARVIVATACLMSIVVAGCAAREILPPSAPQIEWDHDPRRSVTHHGRSQPPRPVTELLPVYEEFGRLVYRDISSLTLPNVRLHSTTRRSEQAEEDRRTFRAIAQEIIDNGPEATEPLLAFLDRELREIRHESVQGVHLDFTKHLLDMLTQIGDLASVPFLLDLLESPNVAEFPVDEQAVRRRGVDETRAELVQRAVLNAVERLTGVRFAGPIQYRRTQWDSILVDYERLREKDWSFVELAAEYRELVKQLGLNRARWNEYALQAAHRMLYRDELESIQLAAAFLQSSPDRRTGGALVRREMRDSDPLATLERVAVVAAMLLSNNVENPAPIDSLEHPLRWFHLLCAYGPHARQYAPLLTHIHCGYTDVATAAGSYTSLSAVGGKVIIDYLAEQLPVVHAKVEAISADRAAGRPYDSREYLRLRGAKHNLELAFDRWAARRFETNEARLDWWVLNRDRPEEVRMRANLPVLVEQATHDPGWSAFLLRNLIDMPECATRDLPQRIDLECVQENLEGLRFDPSRGIFRLPSGELITCD
jgi:hypothetical protein